jgi:galactokinase/galacturonokinase
MAVSAHTVLAFAPSASSKVHITSENYGGALQFDLQSETDIKTSNAQWGTYARAAALALRNRLPKPPQGFVGAITGALPGGGLSSSASVLLSYVGVLAHVNGIDLSPSEFASTALAAERDFVGVSVGILDPAAIVGAQRDHLLSIDTRNVSWKALPLGSAAPEFRILVVYTGISRNLAGTGYNQRVKECFSAAQHLATLSGKRGAQVLGDFSDDEWKTYEEELPLDEKSRARHFFSERSRVIQGVAFWEKGNLEAFGKLMNASCESSIVNYQTGSQELIRLQSILVETPGVFGARFSGAGFGGCSIALIAANEAERIRSDVEGAFKSEFPEQTERSRAFLVESEDGVRVE